jgi:phage terminase large subunit-like protein
MYLEKIVDYCDAVNSGDLIACQAVKDAVNRFLSDVEDERYYFDEKEIAKFVAFTSSLKHFTGAFDGVPFELEPWQLFIFGNIYGLKVKETGKRKYRYAFIFVSRKNGKSALMGAANLYHLVGLDNDPSMRAVIAANSREQAKLLLDSCKGFARSIDPKQKYITQYFNALKYKDNELKIVSSDSKRLDGLNLSISTLDEIHSYPDDALFNVLKSSQGFREEPLIICITTAGFSTDGFAMNQYTYCKNILSGKQIDETQFAMIFEQESIEELDDPSTWYKSNPNLNVTVKVEFLANELNRARNNPSELVGITVKNFNMWSSTESTRELWIPEESVIPVFEPLNIEDFAGCDCWVGVDLSQNRDLTSVSFLFRRENDDRMYMFNNIYLPADSVNTKKDKEMYKRWAADGQLTLTDGNITDYNVVLDDILKVSEMCNIVNVETDTWNASQFLINADEAGLPIEGFAQGIANFNKPTKHFERQIYLKEVVIDVKCKDILKWQFHNVELKYDNKGNCKPDKSKARERIDTIISMIMAVGGYIINPYGGRHEVY